MPFHADRPLLDAFRKGETWALEQVYRHHFQAVATVVRWGFVSGSGSRINGVRSLHDQHDLIHDVFVRAFSDSARLGYDGLRPYGPYLLRIARNLLVDRARRSGREVTEPPPSGDEGAPPIHGELVAQPEAMGVERREEDLDWRRLMECTRTYLSGEEPELVLVVRYRFEEGLPQRDVAQRMGISRNRVRALERQAIKRLRKRLKSLGLSDVLRRR